MNDGDDDDDDSDFDADAADAEDDADDDDDATFAELAGAEGSRGRVRAADPDRIRAADSDRRAKSTSTRAHAETSRERALELLAAAKSQWPLARDGGFARGRRSDGDGFSRVRRRIRRRRPRRVSTSYRQYRPRCLRAGLPAGYVHVSARVYVARAARGGSLWRRAVENYEVRSEAYKAYLDAKKAHEKANSILMGARMHALGQLGPAADADHVTFARHAARCKHIEGIVARRSREVRG